MLVRYTSSAATTTEVEEEEKKQNRQSNQHHGCFISNSLHENVDCEELFQESVVYLLTILMHSPSLFCPLFCCCRCCYYHCTVDSSNRFSLFFHFACSCLCVLSKRIFLSIYMYIEFSKWWECAKVCAIELYEHKRAIDRWRGRGRKKLEKKSFTNLK